MVNYFRKYKQFQSSALFLLCVNLVPPAGVLFLQWDIIDILIIYFAESAVIGFYNFLKIIATGIKDKTFYQIIKKIWACFFFPAHYSGMLILSGAMINLISSLLFSRSLEPILILKRIWPAVVSLTISHGYSFFKNYLFGGERQKAQVNKLMFQPYLRVGVMLLTVVLGTILIIRSGQRISLIIVLVIIKIIIDLASHLRERIKAEKNKED